MALDLSVSETQLEDGDSANPSNCVLLYSEAITIHGTNDILFEVSSSGRLILANFSIERRNGSYFLKKLVSDAPISSYSPEHPTNLSIDKTAAIHEDPKQHMSFVPFYSTNEMNSSRSFVGEVENWAISMDAVDSVPQNLSTVGQNTWPFSQEESTEHAQVEDLSVSEKPVDATLPRSHINVSHQSATGDTSTSHEDEDKGMLSQFVKTLLKQHEVHGGGNLSDVVVSGHNLSELQRFVKRLKAYRHSIGLSQHQLSCELSRHYGEQTIFSQSLLSRFELLSITVRAAFRLLPYLKNWLDHAEQGQADSNSTTTSSSSIAFKSDTSPVPVRALGKSRLAALVRLGYPPGYLNETGKQSGKTTMTTVDSDEVRTESPRNDELDVQPICPAAKANSNSTGAVEPIPECRLADPDTRQCRRERTHFTIATRSILAAAYEKNPRPRGQELTRLALETGHNRESIRIWFCNRRQLDNQTKARKEVTT